MSRIVLAFDPSGNFNEGKGTTGWCAARDGYIFAAGQIYSAECTSQMEYWDNVLRKIKTMHEEATMKGNTLEVVCEDYRLYASKSEAQINSNLETPQLIGAIKWYCHIRKIPITLQMASEVKRRWSNEVLQNKGIITKGSRSWKMGDLIIQHHAMDAVRHCLHYTTFKQKTRETKHEGKRGVYYEY